MLKKEISDYDLMSITDLLSQIEELLKQIKLRLEKRQIKKE